MDDKSMYPNGASVHLTLPWPLPEVRLHDTDVIEHWFPDEEDEDPSHYHAIVWFDIGPDVLISVSAWDLDKLIAGLEDVRDQFWSTHPKPD